MRDKDTFTKAAKKHFQNAGDERSVETAVSKMQSSAMAWEVCTTCSFLYVAPQKDFLVHIYVCTNFVWVCVHVHRCPQSLEEGTESPEAGIPGSCEHLMWVPGPELRSSARAVVFLAAKPSL